VLWRLQEHDVVTKDQKVIRAKVGLLELAKQQRLICPPLEAHRGAQFRKSHLE